MTTQSLPAPSRLAGAVFELLNPVPFGCFVAAMIFDITYARSYELLWVKAAGWLIVIGLIFAIIPRLINLAHVWIPPRRSLGVEKLVFWLNLFGIVAAIFNAFIHSRDAYASMPLGAWLSVITVVLLALGFVVNGWASRSLRRPL